MSFDGEGSENPDKKCRYLVPEKGSSSAKRKAVFHHEPPTKRSRVSGEGSVSRNNLDETIRVSKRSRSPDGDGSGSQAKRIRMSDSENLLGKGGCGSVYGGYRRADNLPVAIKHIPKENVVWTDTDEIGQRLTIEVAAMLKLQTESADSVGKSFIENNKEPLQENQDTNIFHRDIKPKNILIETGSEIPRLRLIDFGLSCFTDTEYEDGWFYGTAKHAPPEYISECVYEAGPATVWQVGIVLYEMLHESFFDSRKLLDNELRIRTDLSTDCKRFLKKSFPLMVRDLKLQTRNADFWFLRMDRLLPK
uniref:non-specific serine/threonine protein kinase n=1 Tax=Nothobranchius furzeri TaxID=105023 RepID=A0A8C6Q0G4_NOTFU